MFRLFSVDNLLVIFNLMLLERKMLFLSDHMNLLCTVIETMCSFLFPFKWFHVCPWPPVARFCALPCPALPCPDGPGVCVGHFEG